MRRNTSSKPAGGTKGFVFLTGSRFVGQVVQFLSVPYYLKWLGTDRYGYYTFMLILINYVTAIDIGFSAGANRFMLEEDANGKRAEVWRLFRVNLLISFLLGLAMLALCLASGLVIHIPKGPTLTRAYPLFALAGLVVMLQTLVKASQIAFSGTRAYRRLALATGVNSLVFAFSGLALVWYFRDVAFLLASNAIAAIVQLCIIAAFCEDFRAAFRFEWNRPIAVRCGRFGLQNYPNVLLGTISSSADKLVVAAVLGTGMLTLYQTSLRFPEVLYQLLSSVNLILLPKMIDAQLGQRDLFKATLRLASMAATLGVCGIFIPCCFGLPFLHLWLKDKSFYAGDIVMAGMGAYQAFNLYFTAIMSILAARQKQHWAIGFTLFNAAATFGLTGPIVLRFNLEGVAIMNVCIQILQALPLSLLLFRFSGVTWSKASQALLKIASIFAVAGVVGVAAIYLNDRLWTSTYWKESLLLAPICVMLTLALLLITRLGVVPDSIMSRLSRLSFGAVR